MGNTGQCRLGLFQDSDFAGDLEDSKIDLRWNFVHILKLHVRAVSHSSTESEIISLDAGLRMEGIPALDLWDLVIEVFHSFSVLRRKSKDTMQGNLKCNKPPRKHTKFQTKTQIQYIDLELSNVDNVSSNVKMLYIFEDDEAVMEWNGISWRVSVS